MPQPMRSSVPIFFLLLYLTQLKKKPPDIFETRFFLEKKKIVYITDLQGQTFCVCVC